MNTYNVPISVKGIVIENGKVWLRYNERKEWELPGGKLDKGEQPEETVVRELEEELGFKVKAEKLVGAYLYTIKLNEDESRGVLVLTYLCNLVNKIGKFEVIGEAGKSKFKKFPLKDIKNINLPEFYKKTIFDCQ
jgi:8-oxo-dGTP pyrophosphatase MutT (NUDIX family)